LITSLAAATTPPHLL